MPASSDRVGLPFAAGAWQTRVQLVFDPATRTLLRKTFTVWTNLPFADLTFEWMPTRPGTAVSGILAGDGRLLWRLKGRPVYDKAAIVAEYRGHLRGGRPDGLGTLSLRDGTLYRGRWAAGRFEGEGLLRIENGAEYHGSFHDGAAEGRGTFIDIDGETYEGAFVKGRRTGVANTILPNKFGYRSTWLAGREIPQSRKIRIAQYGNAGVPQDDVRIGIVTVPTINWSPGYTSTASKAGLSIFPNNPRLMAAWKGNGDIALSEMEESSETTSYGIFSIMKEDLAPPRLKLSIQNRGQAVIGITGFYLDVASSVTDLEPAVQISVGDLVPCSQRHRPNVSLDINLENFGWGRVENPQMDFRFASNRASSEVHHKTLMSFLSKAKVDFGQDVAATGALVPTRSTDQAPPLPCRGADYGACLARLVAAGRLGSLGPYLSTKDEHVSLGIKGQLAYTWTDSSGHQRSRSSPFTTSLLLGHFPKHIECAEGSGEEEIVSRPAVLHLDQSHYRLPIAFEKRLPAGEVARYDLDVTAPKSSEHKFTLVVQLADGRQIRSQPIDLTYFVPRGAPKHF